MYDMFFCAPLQVKVERCRVVVSYVHILLYRYAIILPLCAAFTCEFLPWKHMTTVASACPCIDLLQPVQCVHVYIHAYCAPC